MTDNRRFKTLRGLHDVHALHDYAFIADGDRGALVGPRGELAWMCFPSWAHAPIFSGLLLGPGVYRVAPQGPFVWGGHYEEGTLIWKNRWATTDGICECANALVRPAQEERAVILRRITADDRPARFEIELDLAPHGKDSPVRFEKSGDGCYEARADGLHLRFSGGQGARLLRSGLRLEVTLQPGASRDLVLELSTRSLRGPPPLADALWAQTRANWSKLVPAFSQLRAAREARLAAAVLGGLTTSGGGMVAAATTSIPEHADIARNYDYRYCWIRDQCYAGVASAAAGLDSVLDNAVKFVAERLLQDGADLKPVYTPQGARIPAQRRLALPGYPGADRVLRGNRAGEQFQLDAFGESLLLFSEAARRDRLDKDGAQAARIAAAAIAKRWQEPDAGVWETLPAVYTHSRLICAAGLRQLARLRPRSSDGRRHLQLADLLVREMRKQATRADGAWRRATGDDRVDAALLVPAFRGAFAGAEPRTASTLRAIERELTNEGFAYRFKQDDHPLGAAEGSFLLCQFWLALAYWQEGRREDAIRALERGRSATGSPGLYSEEFNVEQRQQRGNLPQAFVHALMLEAAVKIDRRVGERRRVDEMPRIRIMLKSSP